MRRTAAAAGLGMLALGLVAAGGARAETPGPGAAAPEIAGAPWINSEPLTLAGLRGKVVAVEFWTYG